MATVLSTSSEPQSAAPKKGDRIRFLAAIEDCHVRPGMTGTIKRVIVDDETEYLLEVRGLIGYVAISENEAAKFFEVVRS